jgi:chorismate mutase
MSTTNLKEQQDIQSIINKKGLIIAGPCSAESEEQLLETALALKTEGKTDILRAGIWKPRTNPGGFEGAGVKGLAWLFKAKQQTGLKTGVEVATSKHVEDALSFDVDVLWIGARTTVNPFSVQQIADALKGVKLPVLIKNPVNTDIKLWMGAVERIQKAGIETIGLIHRGFTSFGNTEYRNPPMWQIPIEMKRQLPNYPMICDPSHICGNRENLLSISQKSVDLDYDGIMIETHCNPDAALTDKNQQITPVQLSQLLSNLVKKTAYSNEESFLMELENLREQINHLDEELITLISNRMKVAKQIGDIKKKSKITILQSSRYNEILERAIKKGDHLGLSKEFITAYMEGIHIESIRIQNALG